MPIELDHILVPARDINASAELLAQILGVRWEPSGEGSPAPSKFNAFVSGSPSEAAWREYRAQRASVYVNDSLTFDFIPFRSAAAAAIGMGHGQQSVPVNHYCFRVGEADFDAIADRIAKAGIKFSSTGLGEPDCVINTRFGGKGLYFTDPADGHAWEILTVSYAREPKPSSRRP